VAEPFGSDLATLTLERLQAFLDAEVEEGLTWEAKGSGDLRPQQVRKAVSGFANAIGGSLILGAEQSSKSRAWTLPGFVPPGGEAKTWLSNAIGELAPSPRYDVKVLPTTGGSVVAVVAVEAIDVPPCMSGGSVFERVSGQTVPVTDPAALRALFARGTAARDAASNRAIGAATLLYYDPEIPHEKYAREVMADALRPGQPAFALALAPVAWPTACRARVFRQSFGSKLAEITTGERWMDGPQRRADPQIEQTRGLVQALLPCWYGYWTVRVYADGAASAAFTSERDHAVSPQDVMNRLADTWALADEALKAVGAAGDAYYALYLPSTRQPPNGRWSGARPMMEIVGPMVIGAPVVDGGFDRIQRELEREAGYQAWEPEDPEEAPPIEQAD
jgi:hypothetical protein